MYSSHNRLGYAVHKQPPNTKGLSIKSLFFTHTTQDLGTIFCITFPEAAEAGALWTTPSILGKLERYHSGKGKAHQTGQQLNASISQGLNLFVKTPWKKVSQT